MKIAITGNRNLTEADKSLLTQKIKELVSNPQIEKIFFGGARGADTEALKVALAERKTNVILTCVVPNTIEHQPYETREISRLADEIIELKNEISPNDRFKAYKIRKEYMIDNADEVVAFWSSDFRSGTYSAINYARKQNKKVEIVEIKGEDK